MKYHLNSSIFIKGLLDKSYKKEYLCDVLGVTTRSINNYLNGEKLSKQAFTSLITFLDRENINPFSLIDFDDANHLYHASKEGLKGKISVTYNKNRRLDFGEGFYLCESFFTAVSYVDNYSFPKIYRFNRKNILKHKHFIFDESLEGARDWTLYIGLNRKKIANHNEEVFFNELYPA